MTPEEIDVLVSTYQRQRKAFTGFLSNVTDFFSENEDLVDEKGRPVVHSLKSRLKDPEHLRQKLIRKSEEGREITSENLFQQITDLSGARIMHLRRADFAVIHKAVRKHVSEQHWFYVEEPKAYTWDPEYKQFFDSLEVASEVRESFYTSVHYLVRPNEESKVVCEIQVRSLFEEIWGEIDHDLNYPIKTENKACSEQLRVLAKLVGAGSRLVDSIYNSLD